jgi:hypothetical protein
MTFVDQNDRHAVVAPYSSVIQARPKSIEDISPRLSRKRLHSNHKPRSSANSVRPMSSSGMAASPCAGVSVGMSVRLGLRSGAARARSTTKHGETRIRYAKSSRVYTGARLRPILSYRSPEEAGERALMKASAFQLASSMSSTSLRAK